MKNREMKPISFLFALLLCCSFLFYLIVKAVQELPNSNLSTGADLASAAISCITMLGVIYGVKYEFRKVRSNRLFELQCTLGPKILASVDQIIRAHDYYQGFVYSWTVNRFLTDCQRSNMSEEELECRNAQKLAAKAIDDVRYEIELFIAEKELRDLIYEIIESYSDRKQRLSDFYHDYRNGKFRDWEVAKTELEYLFNRKVDDVEKFNVLPLLEPFKTQRQQLSLLMRRSFAVSES